MTTKTLLPTIAGLFLTTACGDPVMESSMTPASMAGAPGSAVTAPTTELRVTGVDGKPIAGTEVWVLADIDWQNPTPEQQSAMVKCGSNQKDMARLIGQKVEASAPGTYRVAQPVKWMYVTAQAGELTAEHLVNTGVEGPVSLELAPTLALMLHIVDRAGAAVPHAELRVRIELDEQRTVIYPLERADEKGRVDLAFLHRKLRRYTDACIPAARLAFLPGRGQGDEPLMELKAADLPEGELKVVIDE